MGHVESGTEFPTKGMWKAQALPQVNLRQLRCRLARGGVVGVGMEAASEGSGGAACTLLLK